MAAFCPHLAIGTPWWIRKCGSWSWPPRIACKAGQASATSLSWWRFRWVSASRTSHCCSCKSFTHLTSLQTHPNRITYCWIQPMKPNTWRYPGQLPPLSMMNWILKNHLLTRMGQARRCSCAQPKNAHFHRPVCHGNVKNVDVQSFMKHWLLSCRLPHIGAKPRKIGHVHKLP